MHTTHFGFKSVPEEEKSTLVKGVFDSVAGRYDLMNDLMSGGLHRLWKREMVSMLNPQPGMKILDVAGGTGDIAFRIVNAICRRKMGYTPQPLGEETSITILDINRHMLEEGRTRAFDHNILHGIEWICADAETLPFPDYSFDAYTIAFGIRNVTHIEKALSEAFRVLKIGGRFLCLEFSAVPQPFLQKIYDAYSFHVIPFVGEKVTGDRASYQYLVESIRQFPHREIFSKMMVNAGFGNVSYRNLSGGIVAIHSARKL